MVLLVFTRARFIGMVCLEYNAIKKEYTGTIKNVMLLKATNLKTFTISKRVQDLTQFTVVIKEKLKVESLRLTVQLT